MGILSGNPTDEPMHYGEIFGVWSALAVAQGQQAAYEVYLNHTGDQDLGKFINDMIQNNIKPAIEELKNLLKPNEVALPPSPAEVPAASLEEIPAGARMPDPGIAAALTRDLAEGLVADSQLIGICIREDIAMTFEQFHTKKVQMAGRLLKINKDKGWLIPPPLQLEKEKVKQ